MDLDSIKQEYAAKTDDELFALAADRTSLEKEAHWALCEELSRRKLSYPPRPTRAWLHGNGDKGFSARTRITAGLLCVFFLFLVELIAASDARQFVRVFYTLLIWGSIFGAIVWAVNRAWQREVIREKSRRD